MQLCSVMCASRLHGVALQEELRLYSGVQGVGGVRLSWWLHCLKLNKVLRSIFSPERRAEVRFGSLKQEGNDFVKRSQYQEALAKYTECLKIKPEECAIYTNR